MNLFKRTTATVALVALVSSVFATGASAYSVAELNAAAALAAKGYINTQTDASGYNLDATITRAEIAKVAANVAMLEANSSCEGKFADVSATNPNDWVCGYVEALLANGLISANANYNPNANLTKAEAVKLMLTVAGEEVSYGDDWQADFVSYAVENGFVSNFSDYNTAATRGFVFSVAAAATTDEEEEADDILSELDKLINGGDDNEGNEEEEEEETTVVTGNGELEVTLSADTPRGVDLPKNASGIPVLAFDVAAGDEDVKVTGLSFIRAGFGDAAIDEIAAYSSNGRISKTDDFNSDDESDLTVTDFVVRAGSTETITILANTDSSSTGEFEIELVSVEGANSVELSNIVSETFDVNDVLPTELIVSDEGVNANINSGEQGADLVEFKIKNDGTTATSADVITEVTSITLREIGSVDQEDVLSNIELSIDGEVIATVDSMEGKYLTFNFDAIEIDENKSETFKVTADINGGASDKVQFKIDDFMDIQATASKYNAVKVTIDDETFGEVAIDAGELTIYSIDAESDEIRADKDDVVIGELKIVNTSGKSLELQDFGVNLELTTTGSTTDTLGEVFDSVEIVLNNSSEDLDASNDNNASTLYSADDLGFSIPEGATYIIIRGDTQKDIDAGVTVRMTLDADADIVIEETEDDEQVTDITPSSLDWDEVEFVDSTVTVSNVPLADVSVVKGTSDIVALQFDIEAGSASEVTLDKVLTTVTASGSAASNNEITAVALYKTSVSDSNLLDQVSGSKLSAGGVATFDGFEVGIDADATETFIVVISLADNDEIAGMEIVVSMDPTKLELQDSDNDEIQATGGVLSDKVITVTNGGELTFDYDASNDDNEENKTILAGESETVVSLDIEATNEEIDVETIKLTVSDNLKTSVSTASLYLDGTLVATAANSDISDEATSVITFEDMTKFVVPMESVEVSLVLNTETIGYEKIGTTLTSVTVTEVEFEEAKGVDSNEDVTINGTTTFTSQEFSIVPSVVTPTVYTSLQNSTTPQISILANAGDNSEANSQSTPKTFIDTIVFSTLGTTDADTDNVYTLVNVDDNTDITTGVLDAGNKLLTFTLTGTLNDSNRSISSGSTERFKVVIENATADKDTTELTLTKDGITYTVSGESVTTNLNEELDFGSRDRKSVV